MAEGEGEGVRGRVDSGILLLVLLLLFMVIFVSFVLGYF
jgi:hypothetical protein